MKKLLVPASALLVFSACATGGGGGGTVYTDCYTEYCVDYDGLGVQRLYLRTPGTPAIAARGNVTTAAARGGTRVVPRGTPAAASARTGPIPSARPSAPAGSGGRRP